MEASTRIRFNGQLHQLPVLHAKGRLMQLKRRITKALATIMVVLGLAGAGVLVGATPASAATICYTPSIGWNAASGGCDNDGTMDTRLVLLCRVIGSRFEYKVYSPWMSRYTSWYHTNFCYGGSARARSAWYEGRR